jgi:hypothetical protein
MKLMKNSLTPRPVHPFEEEVEPHLKTYGESKALSYVYERDEAEPSNQAPPMSLAEAFGCE